MVAYRPLMELVALFAAMPRYTERTILTSLTLLFASSATTSLLKDDLLHFTMGSL